jgi:hypothetical protein
MRKAILLVLATCGLAVSLWAGPLKVSVGMQPYTVKDVRGRLGPQGVELFERELAFVGRFIERMGWERAEFGQADLDILLSPASGTVVDLPPSAGSSMGCTTYGGGTVCTDSDGGQIGVGVSGNQAATWSTPGPGVKAVGPRILVNVIGSGPVYGIWSVSMRDKNPWQWASELCRRSGGKDCKRRAKEAWK